MTAPNATPESAASPRAAGSKSGNWITWVLVAAVVGLIGLNIAYVLVRDGDGVAQVDEAAPNFTLPLFESTAALGGDEVELETLQGKTVLLEFWSTTCSACRHAYPVLESMHREGRDDVVILTVNTEAATPERARKAVARYYERYGYTVPVAMDNGSVSRAYGVDAIPKTVIIDPDGTIASMHVGAMSRDAIEAELEAVR